MMIRAFVITAISLTLACGETIQSTPADGSVTNDSGASDAGLGDAGTCEIGALPNALQTTEGGRITFTTNPPLPETLIQITAPADWRVRSEAPSVVIRVPYAIEGEFTVSVRADCNGVVNEETIPVHIDRLSWSEIAPWDENTTGPAAREHAPLWIDSANPDRLFLFGGYLFEPRQYTVTSELWVLDLDAEIWTRTSTIGPRMASGRVAPIANARSIFYFGGETQGRALPFHLSRLDYDDDSANWSQVQVAGAPNGGNMLGSFVYDKNATVICQCAATAIRVHIAIFPRMIR